MDFLLIIIWTVGFVFYFLPTIIGWNKRNSNAILALNLLLGWTIIGWIVAFIWSLSKDSQPIIISEKRRKKKNKKRNKKIDFTNENLESDISPIKEWNLKNDNQNLK